MFKIKFSERGSSRRSLEENAYMMFNKLIYEIEREPAMCSTSFTSGFNLGGVVSASQPETREPGVFGKLYVVMA